MCKNIVFDKKKVGSVKKKKQSVFTSKQVLLTREVHFTAQPS